jgi:hypothetical protein
MYYATEAAAELERRAGGPVGQNTTHIYSLTAAEKAYLVSLGVDADPLLGAMNARRDISAPSSSRNYVEHFADYTGAIKAPVVTMHTVVDEVTPVAHESAYRQTVQSAGRGGLLVQASTTGAGHCRFTADQWLAAVAAIHSWVETGSAPASAAFPAELGFVPGFVPPSWPQP